MRKKGRGRERERERAKDGRRMDKGRQSSSAVRFVGCSCGPSWFVCLSPSAVKSRNDMFFFPKGPTSVFILRMWVMKFFLTFVRTEIDLS